MSSRLKILIAVISVLVVAAVALPRPWNAVLTWGVGLHQKSAASELASWGQEFSEIRSRDEASRAIDRLRYIQGYYVPGNGYHGTAATEAALEAQRQTTTATIVQAIEEFTGERFGSDVARWESWRDATAAVQHDEPTPDALR